MSAKALLFRLRMSVSAKALIFITIILFSLTGCGLIEETEISGLSIVQMLAIDENEDGELVVSLSLRDLRDESKSAEESTEEDPQKGIITVSERSFSALERELQKRYEKRLFWGHVDYFIFGEDVAQGNIYKHLDYFSNDPHFRLNANVYLAEGKASDLLLKSEEAGYYLPDYIEHFLVTSQLLSESSKMTLFELVSKRELPPEAFAIPRISISENDNDITLRIDGYGIMKDGYLVGYAEKEEAKGYNILRNKMSGLIIDLHFENADISLKQLKCKAKMTPILENGQLKKIKINVESISNILEIKSGDGSKALDVVPELEAEQAKLISGYIDSIISKMKENKADILGISGLYKRKFPKHYNSDNWDEVISNLEFEIVVNCKINKAYDSSEIY